MMNERAVDAAIATTIEAMDALLRDMLACTDEATAYMRNGQCNAAIGTIIDLGRMLADATALHGAVLALHRRQSA